MVKHKKVEAVRLICAQIYCFVMRKTETTNLDTLSFIMYRLEMKHISLKVEEHTSLVVSC